VAAETLNAPGPDPFDEWCMNRDTREERVLQASERYVPREMIGAEDLGMYDEWRMDPRYGAVWIPARECRWGGRPTVMAIGRT
jgi:hypothetical protein